MTTFAETLRGLDLEARYRPLLCLLDCLSCSPWKFDVLWEVWPELGFSVDSARTLAKALFERLSDQTLFLRAAVAFDDLTIFADVAGESNAARPHPRAAYRLAYLAMRPMLFRTVADAPPFPPNAMTREEYLMRLAMVGTLTPAEIRPVVLAILEDSATRYEGRGQAPAGQFTRQSIGILRHLAESDLLLHDPKSFTEQAMKLMFSADGMVLAYEIALQWWGFYGPAFGQRLRATESADAGAADAVASFAQEFERLAPLAWVVDRAPGVGSAATVVTLLRLSCQVSMPECLRLFPTGWTQRCQERIVELRDEWKGEPSVPGDLLNALLDTLVQINHESRLESIAPAGDAREASVAFAEALAEVMVLARLRSRRDLSLEQFHERLRPLEPKVRAVPTIVEQLITGVTALERQEPSVSAAMLEAAQFLVAATENENLIRMVRQATGAARAEFDPHAEATQIQSFEKQGRPEMAAMACHNLARQLDLRGESAVALQVAEYGWGLISALARGETHLTRASAFDVAFETLRLGDGYARLLKDAQRFADALAVIEQALTLAAARAEATSENPSSNSEDIPAWRVRLLVLSLPCLEKVHGLDAVEARCQFALEEAGKADLPLETAEVLTALSVVANQRGLVAEQLDLLGRAALAGDRARRRIHYESEKIKAMERLQAPHIWGAETALRAGKTWEAFASLDGLRSRALLDLLGLSRGIRFPAGLATEERIRGAGLLEAARRIAFPGEPGDVFGLRAHWQRALDAIDGWLEPMRESDPEYVEIVRGEAMTPEAIRRWAVRPRRTAVVFWGLGDPYSLQGVLRAGPDGVEPPQIRQVRATMAWLRGQVNALGACVSNRRDPPRRMWQDLSRALIEPVADLIRDAEVVYLCPSRELNRLPLSALDLDGEPLNSVKEVAVVASLSVLRALERLAPGDEPLSGPFVFGPEFPTEAARVAAFLGTEPGRRFYAEEGKPAKELLDASLLHLICHGFHAPEDAWESGFSLPGSLPGSAVIDGRRLVQLRLRARVAVLEACDTRRQEITPTDDNFGLGRYLHLAGVPSIVLADWEVHEDFAACFAESFHRQFGEPGASVGSGYRAGVRAVRQKAGNDRPFLWAPFTLVGVAD